MVYYGELVMDGIHILMTIQLPSIGPMPDPSILVAVVAPNAPSGCTIKVPQGTVCAPLRSFPQQLSTVL